MTRPSAANPKGVDTEATDTGGLSNVPTGEAVGGAGESAQRATMAGGQEPPGTPENTRHGWTGVHEPAVRVLQGYGWLSGSTNVSSAILRDNHYNRILMSLNAR